MQVHRQKWATGIWSYSPGAAPYVAVKGSTRRVRAVAFLVGEIVWRAGSIESAPVQPHGKNIIPRADESSRVVGTTSQDCRLCNQWLACWLPSLWLN